MKINFTKLTFLAVVSVIALSVISCNREKNEAYSITIKEVGPGYVDLNVVCPEPTMTLAYDLSSTEKLVTNQISLFADAKKKGCLVDVKSGDVVRISDGVDQDTKYFLYLVAKLADGYSEITTLTFTTKPYDFDQIATIVATNYDGYKVHVTMPESAKKNGNAMRYSQCCLMQYNYSKHIKGNDDYFNLLYNAGAYTLKDTTLVYSEETNWYQTEEDQDQDGEMDWDNHFNPISPGEPIVFLAGEYAWMEDSPEYETDAFKFPAGWQAGYYLPMIDESFYSGKSQSSVGVLDMDLSQPLDPYWHEGSFQRKVFKSREPSLLEAGVAIEVTDIGPVNATVSFIPEEGVYQYAFGIFDEATYNQMMSLLLDNEDYLQWAITSYFAAYTLGTSVASGPIQMRLTDIFYDVPSESKIYVLVTAMGNEFGSTQSFQSYDFMTKQKVLDAPVVTVTPVESKTTPFKAVFNVKADMPLSKAYYGANYLRDWKLAVNGGSDYYSLVSGNNAFSSDDIAKMCSKDGLEVEIPSIDGETTRLVVVGYNEENTPNNLNFEVIEQCPAVADVETPWSDPKTYVPSALYETLVGEWTASATLYDGKDRFPHKSKVVISRHDSEAGIEAFEYPPLSDDVYAIYKKALKKDNDQEVKEIVDGYYADFEKWVPKFGQYRLEEQNRVLCQGWLDKDSFDRLDYISPWDLFVHEEYNSVDVSSIFYDFGPKWYIEISKDKDGNEVLSAPVDANFLPPASNWQAPFYFGGYDPETTYMFLYGTDYTPAFPVEMTDENTFVVKPIVRTDGTFYPNMVGVDTKTGNYIFENPVVSDVVFTRGWEESANEQSSVRAGGKGPKVTGEMPTAVIKPMTRFVEPVKFKKMEGTVMTLDKFKANADRMFENLKK